MAKVDFDWSAFRRFVDEFKQESDRAAVILGAAKLDALLCQILDRHFLPALGSNDELLEGDSPLSTFSSRINIGYRLGLISAEFAKALHLVRKIRNSFAHDASGVTLASGPHSDRIRTLTLPLVNLPFFIHFRERFFEDESQPATFRACLALMIARLEFRLMATQTVLNDEAWNFVLKSWADDELNEQDLPDRGPS